MSSTKKTSLGLNHWESSDKPVREDFVNDNIILNQNIIKLNESVSKLTTDLSTVGALEFKNSANSAEHEPSTKLHFLNLIAGTWLIESQMDWSANPVGRRVHEIRQGSNWNSPMLASTSQLAEVESTTQNCVAIVTLSQLTEISIWGLQTSKGTLGFGGTVKAIRIK